MSRVRQFGLVAGLTVFSLMLWVLPAHAAVDTTAVTAVGDGAADLKDTLVEIATTVLPYAVAIIAIMLGWRLARRFFATR
jgi:hypothetical protein